MSMENTYEKLHKLMNSYVPEFAYKKGGKDPGSVLSDLCGAMIEESAANYRRVIPMHQVQYLNLFDAMKKEPVSAARGYVQFQPVAGYTGRIPVPAGTQVIAAGADAEEYIFETEHDIVAADTVPEWVAVTDRELDRVVVHSLAAGAGTPFYAFDVRGENRAEHTLYLGFDQLFTHLGGLDLFLFAEATAQGDQQKLTEVLGNSARWSLLDPEQGEIELAVQICDGAIRLQLENHTPQKVVIGQKEACYITASCSGELPALYISRISVGFRKERIIPEEVYCNGNSESAGGIYPFGKPLGLYHEFAFDEKEVLERRGARIRMEFELSYHMYEMELELPEYDTEYKAIMKKPKKPLSIRSAEVTADYVLWEYLSTSGWKRLFREEHINAMFNGTAEGKMTLEFVCPEDMVSYEEGNGNGRIRARLIRAENIYQIPAVYKCPFLSGLTLSYSYMEECRSADFAMTRNQFEEKDVTVSLHNGGSVVPFYQTEHRNRAMYLGFSGAITGTPFSLYFDLENYSDRPVRFRVEYLSDRGFLPVRCIDDTNGFTGSGSLLCIVPADAVSKKLYDYEGYFLRILNENPENPEYALPLIKGIYPNMARVKNVNTVTEEFYIQETEGAVDIQLNQQNLLQVKVWVAEGTAEGNRWVLWKQADRMYEGGQTYLVDPAEGILHFRKRAFAGYQLPQEGPHVRVEHANYTGAKANLPAGSIRTLATAVRYISAVTNPFPTYGGYDSYTEESGLDYVAGMLRTRNRAVTNRDFHELIRQTAYGIRKVKCCHHIDAQGRKKAGCVTIAVLTEEYTKGSHVFHEIRKQVYDRLMKDSALLALGRELALIQPRFIRLNVRVWLEKDTLDQAYDLQTRAKEMIEQFIDPLKGGQGLQGWEIGEFPRSSQIIAYLRTGITGCNISRILMTAEIDGKEVPVTENFCEQVGNPFVMAVNGEHIVYFEVSEC